MSSAKGYILKRILLFLIAVALILLYGIQYASIKLSPVVKYILSVESSEEALYNTYVQQHDFYDQWCKSTQEIRNWRAIIHPCLGQLAWDRRQSLPDSTETDPNKSFIAEKDIRPAGEYSRITIVTRSRRGITKMFGGDSWRVKVNGTASVNSRVVDHNNGTYDVLFLTMDQGIYFVYIYLDYSLCNGLRDPPKHWFKNGETKRLIFT